MSLDNLTGISLEAVNPDNEAIRRLLMAAERNIADSHVAEISSETRFDAAYKAIMQLANAVLQANGFRVLTSKPGHHMTLIQTLTRTIGLDANIVVLLDAFRKQRNIIDYSGDIVPDNLIEDCIREAESLLEMVRQWLKDNKPELLE